MSQKKKSAPEKVYGLATGTQFCLPQHMYALSRRQFLQTGVTFTGYMAASQLLGIPASAQASYTPRRRLVWINMGGGWDILEVTDPKVRSTSGIDMSYTWEQAAALAGTNGDVKIGRWLPNLAARGEDILVVRGIGMGTTSHEAGSVYMDTGVLSNAGNVNAASIPAIVASESAATIPIIQLNGGSEPMTDRGLLNPVSTVRAQNLSLYRAMYPSSATESALRLKILDYVKGSLDRVSADVGENDRLTALATAEAKIRGQIEGNVASKLELTEADRAVFTSGAPANMNRGLIDPFALTAKLIKNDLVTCINLGVGGFDTHSNQEPRLQPILQGFDFALATMIDQLREANKLDDTLIVVYSDFGRTPKINGSNGRDHWPVGGALMIGGGIAGGRAVGSTDDNLRAIGVNPTTGAEDSSADVLSPSNLGGSVISLCLGSEYDYRVSYLPPVAALTRLKT